MIFLIVAIGLLIGVVILWVSQGAVTNNPVQRAFWHTEEPDKFEKIKPEDIKKMREIMTRPLLFDLYKDGDVPNEPLHTG